MAKHEPEISRTQTSAPVKPPSTTKDAAERREPESGRSPAREATDESTVRGDRMPKGADEPGAGL